MKMYVKQMIIEQKMTQLMYKAINDKQKSFNTNFKKVCVVD